MQRLGLYRSTLKSTSGIKSIRGLLKKWDKEAFQFQFLSARPSDQADSQFGPPWETPMSTCMMSPYQPHGPPPPALLPLCNVVCVKRTESSSTPEMYHKCGFTIPAVPGSQKWERVGWLLG